MGDCHYYDRAALFEAVGKYLCMPNLQLLLFVAESLLASHQKISPITRDSNRRRYFYWFYKELLIYYA